MKCNCTFAQKMQGDGCGICNPSMVIEFLREQIEELELFKSEHLRLEAELNAILHPNGDGPTNPSFCDLVAYVRADLKPKLCPDCEHTSDCNLQKCIVQDYPNGTFRTYKGCSFYEKLRR